MNARAPYSRSAEPEIDNALTERNRLAGLRAAGEAAAFPSWGLERPVEQIDKRNEAVAQVGVEELSVTYDGHAAFGRDCDEARGVHGLRGVGQKPGSAPAQQRPGRLPSRAWKMTGP